MPNLALFVHAFGARLTVSSLDRCLIPATLLLFYPLSLLISYRLALCALSIALQFTFKILSGKAVAVMMLADFALASLVQLNPADIGVALEELEVAAVILVMKVPLLDHEASRTALVRALDN